MDEKKKKTGLAFWAERVLGELDNLGSSFDPDPVHDLRVALRRCRSMADGFLAVDPDRGWKQLKRAGKELFSRLGELRDNQVMRDWVTQLGDPDDSVRKILLDSFDQQEQVLKDDVQQAVMQFDRKHWETITHKLAIRTKKIPLGGLVFQGIATERWEQARELHRQALRNRSQAGFHRLRIGLKKFRYTVENFLPERHERWGADLRDLQDGLGEIHDLDVLSSILRKQTGLLGDQQNQWQAKIREARQSRVARYREKMVGPRSLWKVWRAELPSGTRLQQAGLARLQTWASFLDPDFEHSKLVAQLSVQLHDGLIQKKVLRAKASDRRLLEAASLLHDVGRSRSKRGHHKYSYRLIRKLSAPLGWTSQELLEVAAVARYHRGNLPSLTQKSMTRLPSSMRASVIRTAAILRLSHALDCLHDKRIRRVQVERSNGTVVVRAEGYTDFDQKAERIAAARHLLESTCGLAVLVRSPQEAGARQRTEQQAA